MVPNSNNKFYRDSIANNSGRFSALDNFDPQEYFSREVVEEYDELEITVLQEDGGLPSTYNHQLESIIRLKNKLEREFKTSFNFNDEIAEVKQKIKDLQPYTVEEYNYDAVLHHKRGKGIYTCSYVGVT